MKHVIIGVGAAGMTAASEIRAFEPDAEIVMISKDHQVHSRCMLHKYISHERDAESLNFTEPDFFEKKKIRWVKEVVAGIDAAAKKVLLESGGEENYDKLLVASGANSFFPPVGDFRKAKNVFGLRHLTDAQAIDEMAEQSENILIVGSGLVGLDAAYGLLERGKKISIVEMADQILPVQLDAHAAAEYQKRFEEAGAVFHLGKSAQQAVCQEDGRIHEVIFNDGTAVACDMIIVAAGVRTATEFVDGEQIQMDRGILVNEFMQTSDPDIYAAGDVAGLSGIWPNAMKQGKTAARNMCGYETIYDDRFSAKNTINFFGLTTLCLGRIKAEPEDEVLVKEDAFVYKRALVRDGKVTGILLQGDISNSGIWQYMIKNAVDISHIKKNLFQITYADFYQTGERGKYEWKIS